MSRESGAFQPPSTPPAISGTLPVEGDKAEIHPPGQPVLNFSLQNVSEGWGWRAEGREDLLGSNPSSVSNLLCDLGRVTSPLWPSCFSTVGIEGIPGMDSDHPGLNPGSPTNKLCDLGQPLGNLVSLSV